ncbi:unnamed protein product [Brachionus calyciflorus]|uniref:RING-type E3 ubiquitin transferase n=1 Tax=Brachionus calyciflorus TaxID=104777 RepID=A0A813PBP2_9BILA|nr:unnamed protein product [Brachionus calyciflorus]
MTYYTKPTTLVSLFWILNFGLCYADIIVFDDNNNTITTFDSLAASFGPNIPDDGFEGYINAARPLTGCSKIEPPPNVSFVDPTKWIAIIQRTPSIFGNCSFDVKVHNAQLAGYSAVIIYNSESDSLIKMSSGGYYNIKIPAVFVGHSTGIQILKYYTYENGTYVNISSDSDISYFLIPFVSVVCVCFLTAVCIFSIKLILHCRKIRKNRFPRSALKKIPTKKYQKTDKYDTCPICLNEYEEGVKIRILPCEHAYHIECIDKWLLRNNRLCPVCKRRVIPGDSESENEDNSGNSTNNPETQPLLVENEPNEEVDESTRLIYTSNQEDNASVLTTSTNLQNLTLGSNLNNNEISSLNNQMIRSINSRVDPSSTILGQNNLATSASRYGSISSINLIENSTNSGLNNDENSYQHSKINSKQTPEYFSIPSVSILSDSVEATTSNSNLTDSNLDFQLRIKNSNEKKSRRAFVEETSEKNKIKKKKSSAIKPINNKNLNEIAITLEKENKRKSEENSEEKDTDFENFQSVIENDIVKSQESEEQA